MLHAREYIECPRLYDSPAVASAMPRYLQISHNVVAAAFKLMKLLPAKALVDAIPAQKSAVETTSGTMGLALAAACAEKHIGLTLVTPPLTAHLRAHLQSFGDTRIIEVDGDQRARLEVLDGELRRNPDLHWTNQYNSPLVPKAYAPVGFDLAHLGQDIVVAPVGSGGSGCGIMSAMRSIRPDALFFAVDAMNSRLFGRKDGPRRVPGIGNSIVPAVMDHSMVDRVFWVSDRLMVEAARYFAHHSGLFLGPTGAVSLLIAQIYGAQEPDKKVSCILPDEGHRYLGTVFGGDDAVAVANVFTRASIAWALRTGDLDALNEDCISAQWARRPLEA